MRKGIISVFILFISLQVSAQKIHFTDTGNVWKQYQYTYNDWMPPIFDRRTYNVIGDTVISSIQYRMFNFSTDGIENSVTYVREDTFLKKLYVRDVVNDSEIVLMDYNLNVGDTFVTNYDVNYHFYYKYVVNSIDSTLINGVWHKVWHFPIVFQNFERNFPSDVIEGIGCIQHPTYMLWHGCGVEPPIPRIYCFSNQGITPPVSPAVSSFDNTTSCAYAPLYSNQLLRQYTEIELFPNPTTTQLTITAPIKITRVAIMNLFAQTIYTNEYNAEKVEINVADLPSGLYFVRINNAEVGRFVKE